MHKAIEGMREKMDPLKVGPPNLKIPRTFGQRAADYLTTWAGSWTFIIGLFIMLAIWMAVNTSWLIFGGKWDPYPFILLNFILSTLAAIQAPIILMSQNRQSQKDRVKAEYDYHINKKAEEEIRDIKKQLDRIEGKLTKK